MRLRLLAARLLLLLTRLLLPLLVLLLLLLIVLLALLLLLLPLAFLLLLLLLIVLLARLLLLLPQLVLLLLLLLLVLTLLIAPLLLLLLLLLPALIILLLPQLVLLLLLLLLLNLTVVIVALLFIVILPRPLFVLPLLIVAMVIIATVVVARLVMTVVIVITVVVMIVFAVTLFPAIAPALVNPRRRRMTFPARTFDVERSIVVMTSPVIADHESDNRETILWAVVEDRHAPFAVREFEIAAIDPAAIVVEADIAPGVAAHATEHVHRIVFVETRHQRVILAGAGVKIGLHGRVSLLCVGGGAEEQQRAGSHGQNSLDVHCLYLVNQSGRP